MNRALASGTAAPGAATSDMLTPIETITDYTGFGYGYGIYVSTKKSVRWHSTTEESMGSLQFW